MAYYYDGRNIEAELAAMGPNVRHAFLIRSPMKTVPSLYKSSFSETSTGWNSFDPKEIGFTSLEHVYNVAARLAASRGQDPPTILDADYLLEDPACTLQAFCKKVGLKYSDAMLTWPKGPLEGWSTWGGWHDDAIESEGFRLPEGGVGKSTCRAERPSTVDAAALVIKMKATGHGAEADAVASSAAASEMGPYLRLKAKSLFHA
jgi:hypothetical protein